MAPVADHDDVALPPGTLPSVAVFGSSEPMPGTPAYEDARQAGARLARAGWAVVNGGYGGVMEAASRGARDAGGEAIGVTVRAFTRRQGGNPWLTREITEDDLYERTRTLVESSRGFLILPGKAGTLAEVSFLWALQRADLLDSRPVVLCGGHWPQLLAALQSASMLDPATLATTWHGDDVDAAVNLLLEKLT